MGLWIKMMSKGGDCEECDCQPEVCDSCFECLTPSLDCRSKSASRGKCGYGHDGKVYLQHSFCSGKWVTESKHLDADGNCVDDENTEENKIGCCGSLFTNGSLQSGDPDFGKRYQTWQYHEWFSAADWTHSGGGDYYNRDFYQTRVVNADCSVTETFSGTVSFKITYFAGGSGLADCYVVYTGSGSWSADGTFTGSYSCSLSGTQCTGHEADDCGGSFTDPYTFQPDTSEASSGTSESYSGEVNTDIPDEYVNEYTTGQLIANTRAAMGDYTGTSCSSYRNLEEGEYTYSERQAQRKISIPEAMPDGKRLKIELWTGFTPLDGTEATWTSEWLTIGPGEKEIDWTDIPVPESNGTNEVLLGSYYCEDV